MTRRLWTAALAALALLGAVPVTAQAAIPIPLPTPITRALGGQIGSPPSPSAQSYLLFYEGNNATQNLVCSFPLPPGFDADMIDLTRSENGCKNDEIRSMTMVNVAPPLTVEIWESFGCGTPYHGRPISGTMINLYSPGTFTVGTFEANSPQIRGLPFYERFYGHGQLDGKVSCIRVGKQEGDDGYVF